MINEHIRNLTSEIKSFKKSRVDDPIKLLFDPINVPLDPITEKLYQAMIKDNTLNYAAYAAMIKRRLGALKKAGIVTRVGSNKNGYWKIMEKYERDQS